MTTVSLNNAQINLSTFSSQYSNDNKIQLKGLQPAVCILPPVHRLQSSLYTDRKFCHFLQSTFYMIKSKLKINPCSYLHVLRDSCSLFVLDGTIMGGREGLVLPPVHRLQSSFYTDRKFCHFLHQPFIR